MKKAEVLFASIACIIACLGDFITDLFFGSYYTGYDRISQPMSTLGTVNSPVASCMTVWWIIMGLLFI
ncbi:MAG: hypothetical protein Q8862_13495, partial [Bacteroidota bacterium]|nr:hypothetical protein [Bacteroidota bacterium]